MTDEQRPEAARHQAPDSDVNVKAVVATGVALLLATALGAAVAWWLAVGLRDGLEERDPNPPTLIEAQMPYQPPSPNLQTNPTAELAAARAEEEAVLGTYGWIDATQTTARVPIERAMQLLLATRPGAEAFDAGLSPQESHGE